MPYCPNCKINYRNGFTICADCGAKLADGSLQEPSSSAKPSKPKKFEIVFLKSFADMFMADMAKSLLNSYGIEVMKQVRGPSDYARILMGNNYTLFGVDLFVSADRLDEAREILQTSLVPLPEKYDLEKDSEEDEAQTNEAKTEE